MKACPVLLFGVAATTALFRPDKIACKHVDEVATSSGVKHCCLRSCSYRRCVHRTPQFRPPSSDFAAGVSTFCRYDLQIRSWNKLEIVTLIRFWLQLVQSLGILGGSRELSPRLL
jgi:hypothetical protein